MIDKLIKPFIIGFFIVLAGVAVGFPLVSFFADRMNSSSFNVGAGPFLVYRFIQDGADVSTHLVPLGAVSWSLVGGILNAGIRALTDKSMEGASQDGP